MVTKTKEPPEETKEEPEAKTEETEVVTKSNLREILAEMLPDFLKGIDTVTEETVDKVDTKPVTEREKESRTYADVAEAIKEFKASLKGEEKSDTKTAEPEKVPGSVAVRWIEKYLWGAE